MFHAGNPQFSTRLNSTLAESSGLSTVFFIQKPSKQAIENFLADQRKESFSYQQLGATRERMPAGYTVDHNRIRLGAGGQSFDTACRCLRRWEMFKLGWVQVYPPAAPIKIDTTVGILIRHLGFYSLNAARIVYVIDQERRFGFAYGTVADHAEQGEERFSIEWSTDDVSVWYDILAFSRPRQWQARLGKPVARLLQKRFARDSTAAMKALMLQ